MSAEEARRQAEEILAQRRFQDADPPRPFRGILETVSGGVRGAFETLADVLPGGDLILWVLIGVAVLVAAAGLAAGAVDRRSVRRAAEPRGRPRPDDPAALERRADEAERHGELERALRLRFRAGLLRLDRMQRLRFRESITIGEVARTLRSPDFDRLASVFDEIVYGRRKPRPGDLDLTREGWTRVLAAR